MIPQLIRGNLKNSDGVVYIKTKKLTIDASGDDLSINVDGDPGPGVPAEIEVLGSHLNILAPKKEEEAFRSIHTEKVTYSNCRRIRR